MTVPGEVGDTVMRQLSWTGSRSENDRELTNAGQMADPFHGRAQLRPGAEMPAFILSKGAETERRSI